jgi:pilus assembly protein CpaD
MPSLRSATGQRFTAYGVRALAAATLSLTLAGCYTPREITGITPNDYRQRHPIAIKEGERTVKILLGTNRGGLTPMQRAEVLAFAQTWKKESTGGIVIDVPAGTPNEAAGADALREIRSLVGAAGVPPHGVSVRPYQPVDSYALATINLNYSKIVAEAGPCGLWPHDLGPAADPYYQSNKPYWNLGCATQRNLAAMVDNPADLVQPRAETPPSAARRAVVMDKYRKGETTEAIYPNLDKAKITDIGK